MWIDSSCTKSDVCTSLDPVSFPCGHTQVVLGASGVLVVSGFVWAVELLPLERVQVQQGWTSAGVQFRGFPLSRTTQAINSLFGLTNIITVKWLAFDNVLLALTKNNNLWISTALSLLSSMALVEDTREGAAILPSIIMWYKMIFFFLSPWGRKQRKICSFYLLVSREI